MIRPSVTIALAVVVSTGLLDKSLKNSIVRNHNYIRLSVSHGYNGMRASRKPLPELTWGRRLEIAADEVASRCEIPSEIQGQNTYYFPDLGTIELTSIYGLINLATQYWAFNSRNEDRFPSGNSNVTQIVWAKTRKVGRSLKICGAQNKRNMSALVVCKYWPVCNEIIKNVYKPTELIW
ncbi:hypothetical protein PENTCL1PPCAC_4952 [Pristionchus entomophagus]|uniref:SCP domain-containing protein n=1 Tax=Pristionchus entomophagus TaxID=358040 RepID=A0AAV5SJA9_9BILA|nr:hypothetical protein PENTCL1PPCAC_4952 [Pristionchus entomophagus]